MNLKKYIEELKRRNVFKVAITYGLTTWLLLQIVETVVPIINAPNWVLKVVLIFLIIGFPIALILAWAFEMSPKGIIRTASVEAKENPFISKKKKPFTSNLIIGVLVIVVIGQFVYNQFWLNRENNTSNIPANQEVLNKEMNNSNLIAVLPFLNSKPDKETDYLGFAIADQIISSLIYLNNITVRPSSSVRKYENQTIDPAVVGKALNVDYILVGNYLNEDNRIRLNIELINLKTNKIVWREPVEVNFESAFKLQDIVTKQVVENMNSQFSDKELNRIDKDIPSSPLAYEFYLRSISYPLTTKGNKLAIEMLNKSLKLDSTYAPTFFQLGYRLHLFAQYGLLNPEETKRAENAYLKALSLNDELLVALGGLSIIYAETGRSNGAVELIKKMLYINSNHADAHFSLGYIYRYAGMNKEAIIEMEKAILIDPSNPSFRSIGITYIWAGEYNKALLSLKNYEENSFTLVTSGWALFRQKKDDKALEYFNKAIEFEPEGLSALIATGVKSFIDGNFKKGILASQKFEQFNIKDAEAWYYIAGNYGLLGDKKGAIRCLNRSVEGGFYNYPLMLKDSNFDSIHEEIGFKKVLQKSYEKHLAFKNRFFTN